MCMCEAIMGPVRTTTREEILTQSEVKMVVSSHCASMGLEVVLPSYTIS